MATWGSRRYGGEEDRTSGLDRNAYQAYGAAMPGGLPGGAPGFGNLPNVSFDADEVVACGASAPVFGTLSSNPKVSPLTAQMAVELGYDPDFANASVPRRGGAVLLDLVIYMAVLSVLIGLGAVVYGGDGATAVAIGSFFLGPGGFYLYRVAGDAIFEGSPGKHALGMSLKGKHGLPISARDGFVRNAWILPSMIPFAGWIVSAGLAGAIALGANRDPLGRGRHEKSVGTRVVEKLDRDELPRGKYH